MDAIQRITRTILVTENIIIKIQVYCYNEKYPSINDYVKKDGNTHLHNITMDFYAYLSLEMKNKDTGTTYDRSRSFYLTWQSVRTFVRKLRKMEQILETEDVYYYNEDDVLSMYPLENKWKVGGRLGVKDNFAANPTLIVGEKDDEQYEGVRLYLNRSSNFVDLVIDEFNAIVDILDKVDLFQYSQMLVNYVGKLHTHTKEDIVDLAKTETRIEKLDPFSKMEKIRKTSEELGFND